MSGRLKYIMVSDSVFLWVVDFLRVFLMLFLFYSRLLLFLIIVLCFIKRKRKTGLELIGWGVGKIWGVGEEGKIVVRIYCMKKIIFNLKRAIKIQKESQAVGMHAFNPSISEAYR